MSDPTIPSGRLRKAPENFLDRDGVGAVWREAKAGRRDFIRKAFATAAAGAGSVAGSGAAPDVSAGATVEPGAGAAAGAGDAPSVTASSAATRGAYATVRIGLRDLSEPVRVVPAYPSAVVRARDHAGAIETRNFADPVRLKAFGG